MPPVTAADPATMAERACGIQHSGAVPHHADLLPIAMPSERAQLRIPLMRGLEMGCLEQGEPGLLVPACSIPHPAELPMSLVSQI